MSGSTEEQLEIRALAREFSRGEIRPGSAEWDADRTVDPAVFSQLAELGFFGLRAPASRGGLELDTPTYLLALEQIAWGDASVALTLANHNGPVTEMFVGKASDEQQGRWLPRLASGELLGAFAFSPGGVVEGVESLGAVARRDGDAWRVEGSKAWVLDGGRAGVVVVFARTAEQGVGAFLVETSQTGYRMSRRETTLGLRASEIALVELDVRVEAEAVLGDPHDGMSAATEALSTALLGVGAVALGIACASLEHAVAYAQERRQFGRSIAEFGAIQEKLSTMASRVDGVRAYAIDVAHRLDELRETGSETEAPSTLGVRASCAAVKLLASELAMSVSDEAVQIFGGYGYMREYPVERLMRDAKGTEIYEGTSESMHTLVARDVLARSNRPHLTEAGTEHR
jgi:alkylation response protein AidB-like acyl-CoA dehydrogenase